MASPSIISVFPSSTESAVAPAACIASIVDSFDAMTTNRPYRKAMHFAEAVKILDAEKDWGQWDPKLVTEFVKLVRMDFKPASS